jgi:hypothetical protein
MRRAGILLVLLAACGPVPLAQAEAECIARARLAEQPRGTVRIGVNSDGSTYLGGEIGVSTDFLTGRDPSQDYDECVFQRAGQLPSRPYYTLPAAQG